MTKFAFHPETKLLASGAADNNIYLWDYCTGELLRTFNTTGCNIIIDLNFQPQGHLLASASHDPVIRIWDVATGECIKILEGHTDLVNFVAYHPDPQRRLLASCSHDETIRLWDTETWECLKVLRPQRVYEDMNITRATGLSPAQLATLKTLGAITKE